jgi:hypothetical protein
MQIPVIIEVRFGEREGIFRILVGIEVKYRSVNGFIGTYLHRSVGIFGVDKCCGCTEVFASVPAIIDFIRGAFLTEKPKIIYR